MKLNHLIDRIAQLDRPETDQLVVPEPEVVAFFVQTVRKLRNWKRHTLADFSGVSLSTIERLERAQNVSNDSLDKIAVALGYERGYLTAPRKRLSEEETIAKLREDYGQLEAVNVGPLRTQSQVRKLANCHAHLIYGPDLDNSYHELVDELGEWLDLAGFILNGSGSSQNGEEGHRRKLYRDILACVHRFERSGVNAIGGVMNAPQEGLPDWKVAVISLTPKSIDPAAIRRRLIFVDRRTVALKL